MSWLNSRHTPIEQDVLLAVADISHFLTIVNEKNNLEVYHFLKAFYEKVEICLEKSEGNTVKYIGDSVFIAFPPENVSSSINNLKNMKNKIDKWLNTENEYSVCKLKVHFGKAAVGRISPMGSENIDIFGSVVNELFMLPDGEFVFSEPVAKLAEIN